jgi:hypothetical protein
MKLKHYTDKMLKDDFNELMNARVHDIVPDAYIRAFSNECKRMIKELAKRENRNKPQQSLEK